MSFWIGNVLLLILNVPLIGIWVRLLTIRYERLYPAILVLVCIGVYSVTNTTFNVWVVVAFGALGTLMHAASLPAPPLLLGFVLGPLMESHFRRALSISKGNYLTFIERPISGIIMAIALCLLALTIYSGLRKCRPSRAR